MDLSLKKWKFFRRKDLWFFHTSFRNKIDELKELEKEINLKLRSVKDWDDLIVEAQMVIENNVSDVAIKYIDNRTLTF